MFVSSSLLKPEPALAVNVRVARSWLEAGDEEVSLAVEEHRDTV
jgi:hypothetical protein